MMAMKVFLSNFSLEKPPCRAQLHRCSFGSVSTFYPRSHSLSCFSPVTEHARVLESSQHCQMQGSSNGQLQLKDSPSVCLRLPQNQASAWVSSCLILPSLSFQLDLPTSWWKVLLCFLSISFPFPFTGVPPITVLHIWSHLVFREPEGHSYLLLLAATIGPLIQPLTF